MDEDEDPSTLAEPSTSGQNVAAAEEKKNKKRKSLGSLDADAKKKKVTIWVRKIKKSTKSWVPDSDSLYRLRDYPEDDNLEFIPHGSTLNEGDMEVVAS